MRAGRGSIVTVLWTSASLGKAIDRCRLMPQSRRARSTLAGVKDRDSIVGLACPNCGAILTYLGHLDGGNPDGARFNVVLWECGGCRGRYSATTDLTDADAVARLIPEPWPTGTYWPG